jgi:thiamine pyrophosphate-dependent acetolactate synthase large subunit-like protein
MNVAQAIAERLIVHGCGTIFGVLGDANLLYLEHFANRAGGRYIAAAHEGGALSMADGFSRASGAVGVASVTHGPGLTNTLTSLIEATRSRTPMVLLTGDTPARPDVAQRIDIAGFIAPTEAGYERAHSAETAERALDRAIARCRAQQRPVVLDLPADVLDAAAPPHRSAVHQVVEMSVPVARRMDLEPLAAMIARSRRPLVLAGRGAVLADACDVLTALADRIGAPVCTTLLAKDLFSGHPRNLGVCGSIATPQATEVIAESDCVIAFGASLSKHALSPVRAQQLGQVVNSPDAAHPDAFTVVGDARAAASDLLSLLDELGAAASPDRMAGFAERVPVAEGEPPSAGQRLDPRAACAHLDRLLPLPRHIVTDAGRHLLAPWRHLRVADPRHLVTTSSFGSIGLGLSTAIGVAIAHPEHPTVAVVGDGGLVPQLAGLSTVARLGLDLIVVVLNDEAYGAERTALARSGLDRAFSHLDHPDFVAVARAMGFRSTSVRTVEQLRRVTSLLACTGPRLLDVGIDPEIELWL